MRYCHYQGEDALLQCTNTAWQLSMYQCVIAIINVPIRYCNYQCTNTSLRLYKNNAAALQPHTPQQPHIHHNKHTRIQCYYKTRYHNSTRHPSRSPLHVHRPRTRFPRRHLRSGRRVRDHDHLRVSVLARVVAETQLLRVRVHDRLLHPTSHRSPTPTPTGRSETPAMARCSRSFAQSPP